MTTKVAVRRQMVSWVPRVLPSSRVSRSGREADRSAPSSAKVCSAMYLFLYSFIYVHSGRFDFVPFNMVARGGTVGWDTALPARRSRVRLPMGSSGFFIDFLPHYRTGADSASHRYEYQESFLGDKGGRCVGLTVLSPSFADCLEILRAPACNGIVLALTLVDFV